MTFERTLAGLFHNRHIEKVAAAIEEHPDNADFSVGEFATEMAMSVSQLSRKRSALIDQAHFSRSF